MTIYANPNYINNISIRMAKKTVQAQPPDEVNGHSAWQKSPPPLWVLKAVASAMSHHIKNEVGLVKGIGLLKNLNQKDGFDCPGCAWPDPDAKRAFLAEYCENGAKAVAEEATKNKVSPLYFSATHSVLVALA